MFIVVVMSEPKAEVKSIDSIVEEFLSMEPMAYERLGASITIWVPTPEKARWDRLQKESQRRLSKLARAMVIAAMDRCDSEPKAS